MTEEGLRAFYDQVAAERYTTTERRRARHILIESGSDDAAKIGESEAEIVITIYGKDGKTAVASASASEKVKGKGNDAVKAAIDKVIGGLLEKIK